MTDTPTTATATNTATTPNQPNKPRPQAAKPQATPAPRSKPKAELLPPANPRPYLLESSTLASSLNDQHRQAVAEIDRIDAEMQAIQQNLTLDIQSLENTAQAEISARRQRRDDLVRIVDSAQAALTILTDNPAPTPAPSLEPAPAWLTAVKRDLDTKESDQQ